MTYLQWRASRRLCHFARMTDELSLAAEFPPTDARRTGASWSRRRSRAPISTSGWSAGPMTGCGSSRFIRAPRGQSRSPDASRARLDRDAAGRPSRSGGGERAGAGGSGERRERADVWCSPVRSTPTAMASTRRRRRLRACSMASTLDAGITIDFNLSPATRNAVRHFAALVKSRKISPASVDIRASINPIGGFAAAGASRNRGANCRKLFGSVRELQIKDFAGRLRSPTDVSSTMPADRKLRNWLLRRVAVEYLRALEEAASRSIAPAP